MEQNSGVTESAWLRSAEFPPSDLLDGSHSEVCIVGAGITGLSCAYQLCSEGRQVLVLDDGPPAGGETCRTTAHLASAVDDTFTELERLHGEDGSRLAYESHAAAIDRIEEIVKTEGIECDFQRLHGYLFAGENDGEETLRQEFEAAQRAGFKGVEFPANSPLPGMTPTACIRFPNQGQFDPIKYLAGLMKAIQRMGGRVVTNKFVTVIEENRSGVKVTIDDGSIITADYGIVATNGPIVALSLQLKQAPYRTYAIGVEIDAGAVPTALYWDTEDPYHYVRLMKGDAAQQGEKDLLIIGGQDHKTGLDHEPAHRFDALYEWAKPRFPGMGIVQFRWSGQVMEPADGVAFIGRSPGGEKMFVSTGDSGMGITHGTIASMLIPDLIQGRANPYESLYDPSRVTLKSLGSMLTENLTAVPQLAKRMGPGEVKSMDDIPAGSAAVIRQGLSKVACYRDESGAVHAVSAKCTHLGCQVEWNGVEKTWDCPCHGSRFQPDGTVLNGPATVPLQKI